MVDTPPFPVGSLAEQYVGPSSYIYFKNINIWQFHHMLAFAVAVTVVTELMVHFIPVCLSKARWLPLNSRLHLDSFGFWDRLYIFINKVTIVTFTYHTFQVTAATETVRWRAEEATIANTVLVLAPMFLLYDFVYSLFHRILHLRCVYGYVHKHHHRQASPSRGHYDAINVHPFEFVVGEYLNLFCFWAIPCHIFAVLIFLFLIFLAATLNHTRYDVSIPGIFDPKDHLVHHRIPDVNFGQYTMLWDKLYGWHRGWGDAFEKSM
mmetsp:Transcript_50204/g.155606  ORF Transcript_50204/g.155606 Transcript_50204/m.155606 type:complete len:264 (-) Transcript_50204:139-930(-)|eukprot:CAMPEP_0175532040 /NCGR_PEP_ID=MMETSP0096-20121207/22469_1 /TAXON_ID=311494 /ORGANISM="Alexandrium monilatum, Strain CCMP3105" /LENGTH=263 /DNA_ID=CAMNT_0016834775 /DNA_START=51 /DNA_END=842 /DNA_ORIENTATION=+